MTIEPFVRRHRKTADEIMRGRGAPLIVRQIIVEVSRRRGVDAKDVLLPARFREICKARNEAMYKVKVARPQMSTTLIGRYFGKDAKSVLHGIAMHQRVTGAPMLTRYDVDRRILTSRRWHQMKRAA